MTGLNLRKILFRTALCSMLMPAACQSNPYVIGRFVDEGCDAHTDAVVCSGFERDDFSDWDETIVVNAGEIEQTATRKHQGSGALHAGSSADQSTAVVTTEFDAVTQGDLFLRIYLYVPAEVATQTINIMFLGDYATPDPFKGVDFNLEDGALQIYVPGSRPDRTTTTTFVIPRDRWFCFQARVTVSDNAGAVQIHVDGELGLDQQGLDTLPPAGVHVLRAGVDWSSDQQAQFDVYMDDLVLSATPVDCDDF